MAVTILDKHAPMVTCIQDANYFTVADNGMLRLYGDALKSQLLVAVNSFGWTTVLIGDHREEYMVQAEKSK